MKSTDPTFGKWASIVSTGLALGIGLVFAIILFTAHRATEVPTVMVGANDLVYYYAGATKEDAIALGQALKAIGFFADRGAGVVLSKDRGSGGPVVSFILNDGAWDLPDAIFQYGEVGRGVAPSVGGFPLKVRLVDSKLAVKKVLRVGKETIGTRDTIFYYGSATSEDAVALGQSLRSAGALKDTGVTVVLAKGDGTTVSFVVKQNPWERPEVVAVYEGLMRQIAPSVGGLPLKLRFLDSRGVIHKEVSVL
jgi:hypothetical protein